MSATANVKGGLFEQYGSTLTQIRGFGAMRTLAARALNSKSLLALRELMHTLNGVAPGSAALQTYSEIDPTATELGGKRTIVTTNLVNRVTTADDRDEIDETILARTANRHLTNSPANLDGNPLGTR